MSDESRKSLESVPASLTTSIGIRRSSGSFGPLQPSSQGRTSWCTLSYGSCCRRVRPLITGPLSQRIRSSKRHDSFLAASCEALFLCTFSENQMIE